MKSTFPKNMMAVIRGSLPPIYLPKTEGKAPIGTTTEALNNYIKKYAYTSGNGYKVIPSTNLEIAKEALSKAEAVKAYK